MEYEGMVISGGRAPEYLRYDADLLRPDSPVLRVGQAGRVRLPRGRDPGRGGRAEGSAKRRPSPSASSTSESFGGTYVDREVVVSGNLVTARTWHDNPAWMREFVRLLNSSR